MRLGKVKCVYNKLLSISDFLRAPMTGVIAQDLRRVLPDAVSTSGPYILGDGKELDNMLIINKDRLFYGKSTDLIN